MVVFFVFLFIFFLSGILNARREAQANPIINLNVLRAISVVNDWSEAKVKAFLHDNGYPTDGVDAGAVDGASMIKLFFDPHARANFCEPVPDGMGFEPEVFETRFKPQMRELLEMHV